MSLTSLRRGVICYKSMNDSSSVIDASLKKQLSVIFFLRRFLKYPLISEEDGVLDSLLITHGHPSHWIHFCSPCLETVITAQKVYLNLTKIEGKLTSLRELVERKVVHSFDEFEEEIAVHQSNCDYHDNRTLLTVRQAIFEKGFQRIKQPISPTTCLEVNVKEEYFSDADVEYPDPLLIPEIEECIIAPECLTWTSEDGEGFRDDECLSTSNFIFTSKGQTSASRRSEHGNVPITSQKRMSSFQYKYKTKGPKKSSVESRTCPVCHVIFAKPSLLTRHLTSHHRAAGNKQGSAGHGDLLPPKYILTAGAELSTNRSVKNENEPAKVRNKLTSFTYKYTTKGPKKSSVESRTCPVCHLIFAKPSLLTRHVRSHVNKGELDLATTNTITEESSDGSSHVNNGECNNFLPLAATANTEESSGVLLNKNEGLRSKQRRIQNPVSYIDKFEDENSEEEKLKKYKNSDSEHSDHDWETGKSDTDVSEDEEESMNETEDQFDDPPLSHQLKVQRPRRKKSNPEDRTCPICKKHFRERRLMKIHLKCLHQKTDDYVCEICGKKYSWPGGLMHHKKKHEPEWTEMKSKFKCTFEGCKMAFRHPCDRKRHEKKHLPEKDFLCNLCGASFRFLRCLTRHQLIHSEEKEHVCSICGDRFRHRGSLLRHNLYKHQTDAPKPFVCEQCGKSFKTKTHLDQHLKSISHGGSGFKTKTSTRETPSKRPKMNPAKMPPPKEQRDLTSAVTELVQISTSPGYPTAQPQVNISNSNLNFHPLIDYQRFFQ